MERVFNALATDGKTVHRKKLSERKRNASIYPTITIAKNPLSTRIGTNRHNIGILTQKQH